MGAKPFSEETAQAIDAEVQKIINQSHEEAKQLLTAHRKQLNALAEALLSRETLNEQEILEVTGLPPAPALDTNAVTASGSLRSMAENALSEGHPPTQSSPQ